MYLTLISHIKLKSTGKENSNLNHHVTIIILHKSAMCHGSGLRAGSYPLLHAGRTMYMLGHYNDTVWMVTEYLYLPHQKVAGLVLSALLITLSLVIRLPKLTK